MSRAGVAAAALAGVVAALAAAATARADAVATAAAPPAPPSKKDARWAAKQGDAPLRAVDRDRLVGKAPAEVINIYNTWTHEWFAVDHAARTLPAEQAARLLRCHFTGEQLDVDPRLPGLLLQAARHFKTSRVNVVSAFRAPKYNLMLRKKGRNVARNSQHTVGHAVDFWLPGVASKTLHDWALRHAPGGVGFYPKDGFVHLDVGPRRTWKQ